MIKKSHRQQAKKFLSKLPSSRILIPVVALAGMVFILSAAAASQSISLESEGGTRSGSVNPIDVSDASGSKAIQFGTVASGQSAAMNRVMANAPYWGAGLYWPRAREAGEVDDQKEFDVHVERVGRGKKPDVLRVFGGTGDANNGNWTWPNVADANVKGHDGITWVSFKVDLATVASGSQTANWVKSIKTIPTTGPPVILTIHHEPENDAPSSSITAADPWVKNWLKAQVEIGRAVQQANNPNVVYGPIFMGKYYLGDVSETHPRSLYRWMALAEKEGLLDDLNQVYDFVGWDPYHEGSRTDKEGFPKLAPPRDTADYWFKQSLAFNKKYFPGKEFAIGEIGYVNEHPEAQRLAWLQDVKKWVDERPGEVMAVCYFDASINVNWYLSLGVGGRLATPYQKQVAEFWGSLYKD